MCIFKGVHDEIDAYIKKNFPSKVRMLKTKRREGLIRARIFGAKQSTGQVSYAFFVHSIMIHIFYLSGFCVLGFSL